MPIELKITGDNAKDFFQNAAHAFLLLAHGGNTVFAQPPAGAQGAASAPAGEAPPQADVPAIEAVAEENPKVTAEPKQRKKAEKKAPVTVDNAPPADLPAAVDDDPLGLNDVVKRGETVSAPTYTLDDMRQRVKNIIGAGTARGATMPENVAYVRKLFAPFGVKLAAELKPAQFAEFMTASQPYLDGTAE